MRGALATMGGMEKVGRSPVADPGSAAARLREIASLHCESLDLTALSDISLVSLLPVLMRASEPGESRLRR